MISRSGEVPIAFSTQVSLGGKTLCCGLLEQVFAILLQKHLQVSSLARAKYCTSRAKYFTNPRQHSHGVAPLGALHLEYGIGEISWSLAAWDTFLFDHFCGKLTSLCFPCYSVSTALQVAVPNWVPFTPLQVLLVSRQKNRRKLQIFM